MKNDQAIADIARTMKMYSMEGDQGSITDCVLRANRQGLDGQLIRFLTFHCSDETFAELVQAPGRKLKVVHYAKSIHCPRYFLNLPPPPKEVKKSSSEPVISKLGDDWHVMGADDDGSSWCSEPFKTHAAAYRWLDRRNAEVTTPSEKRQNFSWTVHQGGRL